MTSILRRLADALDERIALRLTLLLLLLRPPSEGPLRGLMWLVAGAGLVVPALAVRPATWFALTTLMGVRLVGDWPLADNHLYLLAYWCLAIALALGTSLPGATLARSSRWLVGLAFLCAIVWKGVLAPDFLDARFFRITLLTDERFASATRAIGGLTSEDLDENRAALDPLPAGAEVIDGPILSEPKPLRVFALALTWGGFALELLVAAAFLAPGPRWLVGGARHGLLMAFCISTYAVAPVAGFGWLLAAMGLAQLEPEEHRLRVAYVAVFSLIFIYAETPLVTWLFRLIAP